jgi:hypothetical protein
MAQWIVASPEERIKRFFNMLNQGSRDVAQKTVQAHLGYPKKHWQGKVSGNNYIHSNEWPD